MSFAKIFKSQIEQFTQVAKKLDERMNVFASQLAKRLDVDENKMLIEFQACLKYFELEESKEMEKVLDKEEKKRQLEAEKAEKLRQKEEEKAEKLRLKEIEKQKKDEEKAQLKLQKEQEKAQKILQKEQEKELKKKEKEESKSREKEISKAKKTPTKFDEGFDFTCKPIHFDNKFWEQVKQKTIQGQGVNLHEETGLIFNRDEHPVLVGIKNEKGVILEAQMQTKYQVALEWAKQCGFLVPSLPDEEEEEEEIVLEQDEDEDDLELTE